jgi:hypothetical protein
VLFISVDVVHEKNTLLFHLFFLLVVSFFSFFFFDFSSVSSTAYEYGVIYSTDEDLQNYHVKFQNSTINNITTGSTMGGAITVFPSGSSTLIISLSSFSNINLVNTSTTFGGFVYISTTPQLLQIHNSSFSYAKVC